MTISMAGASLAYAAGRPAIHGRAIRSVNMRLKISIILVTGLAFGKVIALTGQVSPDPAMYRSIREEGTANSRVMAYAEQLIDGIGPRLTGSPDLTRATEWARRTLQDMGCTNVRSESWGEFGLGWEERNVWLRMTQPDFAPMIVRAAPWSPSTRGPVSGELVAVRGFTHERDFEAYRGKLRGKIVLLGTAPAPPEVFPIVTPLFERLSEKQLAEFALRPVRAVRRFSAPGRRSRGAIRSDGKNRAFPGRGKGRRRHCAEWK